VKQTDITASNLNKALIVGKSCSANVVSPYQRSEYS
jgi:hypothetical protein